MIRIETSVRRDRVIFAVIGRIQKKAMYDGKSFVAMLFLVANLAGANPAIAAEGTSPPLAASHEVKVLRRVAAALAAGTKAVDDLRGPPIEHSNLNRLKLDTPGMDCGIHQALIFVVCRSVSLNRQEAEAMFGRMMDYGQAALMSDGWRQVEDVPDAGLIRSISYHHLKSNAQIDLDLVVYPSGQAESLYGVRFFGWKRF